ncbi:MAG TPA: hypothetical protein ENK50_09235 [Sedimenticola sp.]|nr:hypothetical protein [Sedimenticola sp.]
METLYKVVYAGELTHGMGKEEVVASLVRHFGLTEQKARLLLDAGRPVTLKRGLSGEQATQLRNVLERLGLNVRLEEEVPEITGSGLSLAPIEGEETATGEERTAGSKPRCPKCGSSRIQDGSCLECGIVIDKYLAHQARNQEVGGATARAAGRGAGAGNPYAAPRSEVVEQGAEGEITGPLTRPAGHGWAWFKGGFRHFRQNPFAWIFALLGWMVLAVIISLVPLIGSIAVTLLSPVITAGFMIGADQQRTGGDFRLGHLFAGFSRNTGQLLLVGTFYFLGLFLVGLVAGGMMVAALSSMDLTAMGENPDPRILQQLTTSPLYLGSMLVALLLSLPLLMAYWYAPPLVALDGYSALAAMRMSFSGCWKNMLSLLVYGLVVLLFLVLGMIPFGLGLLIVVPVLVASMYVSYRDVYYGD